MHLETGAAHSVLNSWLMVNWLSGETTRGT